MKASAYGIAANRATVLAAAELRFAERSKVAQNQKLDTSNNPASHAGQGCERAGGRIGPPIRGGIIGFARPAGAPASPYRHAAAYFARSQTRRRML